MPNNQILFRKEFKPLQLCATFGAIHSSHQILWYMSYVLLEYYILTFIEPVALNARIRVHQSTTELYNTVCSGYKQLGQASVDKLTKAQNFSRTVFTCGILQTKGQLISKCLLSVFIFFQKNEQKQVKKLNLFIRFIRL